MAHVITHREFKLLLGAESFPSKRSVIGFNDEIAQITAKLGVHYEPFEALDCGIRQVRFFDTADQLFRRNNIILRIRRDQSGGWPDETWEVTFKRRSPDYAKAADFEIGSSLGLRERRKFKEEILRGDALESIRRIYSNNNVLDSPLAKFEAPMSRIAEIFPACPMSIRSKCGRRPRQPGSGLRDPSQAGIAQFRQRRDGAHGPGGVDAPGRRCVPRVDRRTRVCIQDSRLDRQASRGARGRRRILQGIAESAQRPARRRVDQDGLDLRHRRAMTRRPRQRP